MALEKIIKQENGDRIHIKVDMYFDSYGSIKMHYGVSVTLCPKGKQKFTKPIDTKRGADVKSQIIALIGVDQYNNAILDAWNSLKPELL